MNGWELAFDGFDPRAEALREALCTLGNGYFATRGAAAHAVADGVHYPGTYLAGGYDRLVSQVAGRDVENEDLVNLPNWLPLTFRLVSDGPWFDLRAVELLAYRQVLDLREGLLVRDVSFKDGGGRRVRLRERRLVHMGRPYLAALELTLTAEGWSGPVEVRSGLDAQVANAGVARYRALAGRHLEPLDARVDDDGTLFVRARTVQSRLEVALAARTTASVDAPRRAVVEPGRAAHDLTLRLEDGRPVTVEKVVALRTSRDWAISEPGLAARQAVARAGDFESLRAGHALAWRHLWRRFDLALETADPAATERTALLLRLHVFHLLQTASLHTTDLDVGVPARGWHGEAYRGHVFWDELFIFPLLNWRLPEVTRALLLYRYRRLDEARALARAEGLEGALFPWQSGSDGREETQRVHLNPRSGRWVPDETHLQRHVNAAVAYNVWEYYQVTGDVDFLAYHGAEMLLEIARLWSSLAALDPGTGRYSIAGVVGPDEFHTRLPGAAAPGLRDNAYTNVMAVWTLCRAREALDLLSHERRDDLREAIGLRDEELARWDDISRRMRVVFHEDGVISQFDGYERLEELDWGAYRAKYGDIHRLDRILEAEDDTPNRYKVSKQADVLMLFYLLSATRLRELFERLGYAFDLEVIPRTIDYYARRTSHGSTLSRVVDAWVLSRVDRPRSWRLFQEALESDVADIQGGTTAEGIHLGAMSGTVDLVQRCYTGIVTRDDVVWFDPRLPDELRCLRMTIVYRGLTLDLRFTHEALEVQARPSNARPIRIGVRGGLHDVCAGEARRFALT